MDAPIPETLPNGTQAKAEEMSAEAGAHLKKMAERMAAITEMGKCLRCEQVHQAPRIRWKCEGCEEDICWNAVWPGAEFSRPNQNIHCLISRDPKRPDIKRICGVVTRIEEPLPFESTGEIE